MQRSLVRKGLVLGIIVLFVGVSVTPSISGDIIRQDTQNTVYNKIATKNNIAVKNDLNEIINPEIGTSVDPTNYCDLQLKNVNHFKKATENCRFTFWFRVEEFFGIYTGQHKALITCEEWGDWYVEFFHEFDPFITHEAYFTWPEGETENYTLTLTIYPVPSSEWDDIDWTNNYYITTIGVEAVSQSVSYELENKYKILNKKGAKNNIAIHNCLYENQPSVTDFEYSKSLYGNSGIDCDLALQNVEHPAEAEKNIRFTFSFEVICLMETYNAELIRAVITCEQWEDWDVEFLYYFDPGTTHESYFTWPDSKTGNYDLRLTIYPKPLPDWNDIDWSNNFYTVNIGVKCDLGSAFLLGFSTDLNDTGDYIEFKAELLLYVDLETLDINIYFSGEELVVSNEYQGLINEPFIIGVFNAAVVTQD